MGFYVTTRSESASPNAHSRHFSCGSKNAYRLLRVKDPGYRLYNSGMGRWMSRDPIGERGGRNVYGFVGNAPIGQIDPIGLTVGSITVPIFNSVSTSTLGWKERGWLFSASWTPPTGGGWDSPCKCKPCQKVVWIQEAGWILRRVSPLSDIIQPWHQEWTAAEAGDYGAVWECGHNTAATVNDQPSFSTFFLGTITRWLFQAKTSAKCVAGKDAGKVYGTVRWGAGWLPPDTLTGYGPVIY
ncbi:MAG: RHS repeat-associated core domain-containing protein [bacterium]